MNEDIKKIKSLDYSHNWTTACKHIQEIYWEAKKHKGGDALEIGAFLGHATYALCLAGLNVTYYDLEHRKEREELLKEFNVKAHIEPGDNELKNTKKYDVIFHDSYHGDRVIPELTQFYKKKLKRGGVLMIHDIQALNQKMLLRHLGCANYKTTKDRRKRILGFCYMTPCFL